MGDKDAKKAAKKADKAAKIKKKLEVDAAVKKKLGQQVESFAYFEYFKVFLSAKDPAEITIKQFDERYEQFVFYRKRFKENREELLPLQKFRDDVKDFELKYIREGVRCLKSILDSIERHRKAKKTQDKGE